MNFTRRVPPPRGWKLVGVIRKDHSVLTDDVMVSLRERLLSSETELQRHFTGRRSSGPEKSRRAVTNAFNNHVMKRVTMYVNLK